MRPIDQVSGDVLDVALRLHPELGPGLLESVYEVILAERLTRMGYPIERQRAVDVEFEGVRFAAAFKAGLIVGRLVVEIKSVERLAAVHAKRLLTYLRLLRQPVGLLITFGGETLREGVRRVVNNHSSSLRASAPPLSQPSSFGDQ